MVEGDSSGVVEGDSGLNVIFARFVTSVFLMLFRICRTISWGENSVLKVK